MKKMEEMLTLEEVKQHGKKVIAKQARILEKNLREKRNANNYSHV